MQHKKCFQLLDEICQEEEIEIPEKIKIGIFTASLGSARLALVMLDKIKDLDENEMQEAIKEVQSDENSAFGIVKPMFGWGARGWSACSEVLLDFNGDVEGTRRYLRSVAMGQLLKAKKGNNHKVAFAIMQCTEKIMYDKTDLVYACFDIINEGN